VPKQYWISMSHLHPRPSTENTSPRELPEQKRWKMSYLNAENTGHIDSITSLGYGASGYSTCKIVRIWAWLSSPLIPAVPALLASRTPASPKYPSLVTPKNHHRQPALCPSAFGPGTESLRVGIFLRRPHRRAGTVRSTVQTKVV